jgi:hypothetical protein
VVNLEAVQLVLERTHNVVIHLHLLIVAARVLFLSKIAGEAPTDFFLIY